MTTPITQSPSGYLQASGALMVSVGTNAVETKTYSFISDNLPHTGQDEEFEIDEYIEQLPAAEKIAIDAAGPWVADVLYPDRLTLAAIRLRAQLSQKDLGDLCGLKQPHISRYESGAVTPSLVHAKKIAVALKISLDGLYEALSPKGED